MKSSGNAFIAKMGSCEVALLIQKELMSNLIIFHKIGKEILELKMYFKS